MQGRYRVYRGEADGVGEMQGRCRGDIGRYRVYRGEADGVGEMQGRCRGDIGRYRVYRGEADGVGTEDRKAHEQARQGGAWG